MLDILREYEERGLVFSQNHPSLPLSIWNYNDVVQFEGLWDDVTLKSRALVVDNNTGLVVARAFSKFFNIEEFRHNATENFEVYEKMDGSLGLAFFYDNRWIFASRGSFNSDQSNKGYEMFMKCNVDSLDKDLTYVFEIIYVDNRIVVDYEGLEFIVLLSAFRGDVELTRNELEAITVFDIVTKYDNKLDFKELKELNSVNREGFVIRFENGERCKIKFENYITLHKIMSDVSTTSVWECLKDRIDLIDVLNGVPDEFYSKIKDYHDRLLVDFLDYKQFIYSEYDELDMRLGVVTDKEFALNVIDSNIKSYLFSIRKNRYIDDSIWRDLKPKFKKL